MPWLTGALLLATPFALALLYWHLHGRLGPAVGPIPGRLLWLALAGVALAALGAAGYGLGRREQAHERYVPARLGADGRVLPAGSPP